MIKKKPLNGSKQIIMYSDNELFNSYVNKL